MVDRLPQETEEREQAAAPQQQHRRPSYASQPDSPSPDDNSVSEPQALQLAIEKRKLGIFIFISSFYHSRCNIRTETPQHFTAKKNKFVKKTGKVVFS